jgi:hypothetical protein
MSIFCPECELKHDIPKLLPCGYAICSRCEANLKDQLNFSCKSCYYQHIIPNDGYQRHMLIEKLLDEKNNDLKNSCNNALLELEYVKLKLEKLSEEVDKSETTIKSRCENLRNEIDISTEILKEKINKYRDELINEIDEHEAKQINLVQDNFNKDFKNSINEINDEMVDLGILLKADDLDEVKVTEITNEIEALKEKIEEKIKIMNSTTSKETKCFVESTIDLDKTVIGKLSTVINTDSYVRSLTSFGRLKINYSIKYREILDSLVAINDNKDVALYIKYSHMVGNRDFNEYQLKLYRYQWYVDTTKILISNVTFLNISLDLIYVYFEVEKEIFIFDFDFIQISRVSLPIEPSRMFITENEYSITTKSMPTVHLLDAGMKVKVSFGQSSSVYKAYYIPSTNVRIQDGLIYACCNNSLRVLNEETGRLFREIKFKYGTFKVEIFGIDIKILVVSGKKERNAQVYDLNENMLLDISLGQIDNIDSVQVTDNGCLIINEKSKCLLYFN